MRKGVKGITFYGFTIKTYDTTAPGHTVFKYSVSWKCELCGEHGIVEGDSDQLAKMILDWHKQQSPACDATLIEEVSAP